MILYLTDPLAPDYGSDYLYDGFRDLGAVEHRNGRGPLAVIDWPPKPNLHGVEQASFDCDLAWPAHAMGEWDIEEHLAAKQFDLVVVSTLRGFIPHMLTTWRQRGLLPADVLVTYDAEDDTANRHQLYCQLLGCPPVAEFKRELPIGASWARPLPFGYPARRVVQTVDLRAPIVVCAVQRWEHPAGARREILIERLKGHFPFQDGQRYAGRPYLALYPRDGERLGCRENHAMNRHARVAVVPAGAGWGTNRYLEVVADGCVLVAEQPTVQMPEEFVSGVECSTYQSNDGCLAAVEDYLGSPSLAQTVAGLARAKLLRYHTTRVRARTVWAAVHGGEVDGGTD